MASKINQKGAPKTHHSAKDGIFLYMSQRISFLVLRISGEHSRPYMIIVHPNINMAAKLF
jgi:hypothetical protein